MRSHYFQPNLERIEQIVHHIDPSLRIIEPVKCNLMGESGVCKVKNKDNPREMIFKWVTRWNKRKVYNEARAIQDSPDPENSPELIAVYSTLRYIALTKTFLSGSTGAELYGVRALPIKYYQETKKKLEGYHNAGISGLDPVKSNILFYQGNIHFFDFGHVAFATTESGDYEDRFREDEYKLKCAFGTLNSKVVRFA